MTAISNIPLHLAQDIGEWSNLVWLILVLAVLAVSGWIRRSMEKKQEQEAQRRQREAQRQAPQQRQAVRPRPVQQRPPAAQPMEVQREPPTRRRRAEPPPVPDLVSAGYPEVVVEQALAEGVEEELRHEQRRLRQEELRRRRRLAARTSPEADTAAIERRLGHLGLERAQPSEAGARRRVIALRPRGLARRAIIYHEIFSPPKALRQGREMWDV